MSATSTAGITTSSVSSSASTCISVIPDKNGYVPEWACNANYNYYPSFGAAVFFAVAFGASTFLHIFQAFYHKKLRLSWVIIMGVAWLFSSFSLRAAGAKRQQEAAIAYVSQILLLLAPMWINAFCYMVMGRMIYFFVPSQQIWRIKGIKIAKIFVWLDILSFLTQLGGGVMISPDNSNTTLMLGIHLYMGGIGFQQLCIIIFISIAIKFHLTMRSLSRSSTSQLILSPTPKHWGVLLYVLYACLALITIRIIFRLVEFAAGLDASKNPIPYHEAYVLVLDAAPMLVAAWLMNVVHPGRILKGEGSEFPRGLSWKEKRAAKRLKKKERRALKEEKKRRAKGIEVEDIDLGLS